LHTQQPKGYQFRLQTEYNRVVTFNQPQYYLKFLTRKNPNSYRTQMAILLNGTPLGLHVRNNAITYIVENKIGYIAYRTVWIKESN